MRRADSAFWNGKNVLVTGHSGYKGTWLSAFLKQLGAKVTGVSLELSSYNFTDEQFIIDTRNHKALTELVCKCKPEIVFHLAGISNLKDGFENPVAVYEINVTGTANLLESIREAGSVRSGVIVTSDKCYKDKNQVQGYNENDELGGLDPYSASKAACELVVGAFRHTFCTNNDLPAIATARCSNLIGGGDMTEGRLIPVLAKNAASGKPIGLRNPSAVRPWLYILDGLHGYLILAEMLYLQGGKYAGAWNFGPLSGDIKSVRDLADSFCCNWGAGTSFIAEAQKNYEESLMFCLDISKSMDLLQWNPIYGFDKMIEDTVAFYKQHINSGATENLYREMIGKFLSN